MLTIHNFKPLFYTPDGDLVVAKKNKIFSFIDGELRFLFAFPITFYQRIFSVSKLARRLLRTDVMSGVFYKARYYFVFSSSLYEFEPEKRKLAKICNFNKGRGPLYLTTIENNSSFLDGIYYGEYFGNSSKDEVNVWRFSDGTIQVVHKFSKGKINHVHNLVYDKFNRCLWILVGDFGDSAAIYRAFDNFNSVEKVVGGSQIYRACVAFPTSKGLLYATDTQKENNSVRMLSKSEDSWFSQNLFDLNGSCIYGAEVSDYYIFSTATEPSEKYDSALEKLLDNKPGPGIIYNRSDVISCSKKNLNFSKILELDKDRFPYRLFQFGAVMFPSGVAPDNTLFCYSVGGKTLDLKSIVKEIKD